MKIIYDGIPEGNEIKLESITCVYIQEADCTEDRDVDQTLTISTRDGGSGKFINIQTSSWSINDVDELVELINSFKNIYEKDSDNS